MWKNIINNPAPENILLKVKYAPTGIRGAIVEDWTSVGTYKGNGLWSIKINKEKTVTFNLPTHWDYESKSSR